MKTVALIKTIGKIYLYVVGAFMILMSFDCFDEVGCPSCGSFWDHLLCFSISVSPGVVVILLNYLLRNKVHILGMILTVLSIGGFFLFKFYLEFVEKIPMVIIISLVPLCLGVFFIASYYKNKE